jgi:hypothetical protein
MSEKTQSAHELIKALGKLVADANKHPPPGVPLGACIFNTDIQTYCWDNYTEAQCDFAGGIWTQGGTCN